MFCQIAYDQDLQIADLPCSPSYLAPRFLLTRPPLGS